MPSRLDTDELILKGRGHLVIVCVVSSPALDELLAKADIVIHDVTTMNPEAWQQLKKVSYYRKANGDSLPIFCKSAVLHLPATVLRIERLCTRFAYAK